MERTEVKYFLKHIPAEGDVKSAEYVFYKHELYHNLPKQVYKDPEIYSFIHQPDATRGYHEKWEDLKLAKLVLCTTDVNVGDTDFYVEPQGIPKYENGFRQELMSIEKTDGFFMATLKYLVNHTKPDSVGQKREWPYQNIWKVVGDVSPDALWLERGMQFEDKDIRIKLIHMGYKIDPSQLIYVPDSERSKWKVLVEFICPSCKKFK